MDNIRLVDLTAGGGQPYEGAIEWWRGCSPGVLGHHAISPRNKLPTYVTCCEQHIATYERLLEALHEQLPLMGYEQVEDGYWVADNGRVTFRAYHGDSSDLTPDTVNDKSMVFLISDPNAISSWPVTRKLLGSITDRTNWLTAMFTLGCNVNGLKRSPAKQRVGWLDTWEMVEEYLEAWKNVILCAIDNDKDRWGYAFTLPAKWTAQDMQVYHDRAAKEGVSFRSGSLYPDRDGIEQVLKYLLLTVREIEQAPDGRAWRQWLRKEAGG